MVHRIAGEQGEAEVGDDFCQADQAQGEGITRDFVDVPADGDGDDLVGQQRQQAIPEQARKAAIA
jgi:hypothetical protein